MMMKRLSALAALAFLAGCPSSNSFSPTKTIADVEPNTMASGRTKTVEVHGNFTKWKDSNLEPADVSFGAGITIDQLVVSNESLLIVTLTAADNAAPGPRDVDIDGEIAVGAFNVVPPFEILNATPVAAGDFMLLDIVGFETDWLEGRTVLTPSEPDVYTDGFDLFGATFTDVVGPTFIQAIVQVDLFASAGPRGLSINGITTDDANPAAFDVVAHGATALTAGNNVIQITGLGGISAKRTLTAANAGTLSQLFSVGNTAFPVIGVFDQDLGMMEPVTFFGDDDGFFGLDAELEQYNFVAGKNLVLVAWDAVWLDELFFGNFIAGEGALAFDLYNANTGTALTAGAADTGEALPFNGAINAYTITPADRWNMITVDMTPDVGSTNFDAQLFTARRGATGAIFNYDPFAGDQGFDGDPEQLVYLGGEGLSFVTVRDYYDGVSAAGATYDLVFNEAPLAATGTTVTRHDSNDVDIAIAPDQAAVYTSNVNVAAATADITEVKLAVDIDHTYRGDLLITLTSPSMTTVDILFDDFFDDADGLIEVFPDTLLEAGSLADFVGEDANGTWTLTVEDTFALDGGMIRNWSLAIGGN